jgi:hypothetical protein
MVPRPATSPSNRWKFPGAYERLLKGDVRYRFVIDNSTLAA